MLHSLARNVYLRKYLGRFSANLQFSGITYRSNFYFRTKNLRHANAERRLQKNQSNVLSMPLFSLNSRKQSFSEAIIHSCCKHLFLVQFSSFLSASNFMQDNAEEKEKLFVRKQKVHFLFVLIPLSTLFHNIFSHSLKMYRPASDSRNSKKGAA